MLEMLPNAIRVFFTTNNIEKNKQFNFYFDMSVKSVLSNEHCVI